MKKLSFTILLFIGILTSAQPVINAADHSHLGNFTLNFVDSGMLTNLSAGPAGANQTWNFSQYMGNTTGQSTITACPGTSNCSNFPVANRLSSSVLTGGGYNYAYLLYASNKLEFVGANNSVNSTTTTFTDYKTTIAYPMSYQQQFNDTFASTTTPSGATETGTTVSIIDAYGTITTAAGTFSNVLREKTTEQTTKIEAGMTFIVNIERYSWYSKDYDDPLLTILFIQSTIPGTGTTNANVLVYSTPSGVLSTTETTEESNLVNIYPNPSSDYINIQSKESIIKVEISNAEGRMVMQTEMNNKINISKLPSGVYFLKIKLKDGKSLTKKFIKK